MEIDLVYLWVDSADKNWLKRKNDAIKTETKYAKDAISDCRFINNDELKYSLRSVVQNAPWVKNIFIVTDKQVPEWINLENKRIKIVDHSEIIPIEKLPLFNSCAIESRIPFIPNLSENFIYANDDMFIWQPIEKTFFFENNKAICRVGKKIQNREYKHIYGYTITNAYKIIKNYCGINIPYFPHHGIDAYKKSTFIECIKEFEKKFDETLNHKIRDFNDLQRVIVLYYMLYKNVGILKQTEINLFNKLIGKHSESDCYDLKKSTLSKIKKSQAKLMCINDCRKTTDKERKAIKELLENKFPIKSEFEK